MTTEEIKDITRAVVLALREELSFDNKEMLGKLSMSDRKLCYDGDVLEERISAEVHNNLCRKADGLYARNNYVTTESSPVGEIIAFMGTTAPEHYLFCNGATYQIGKYPLLEAFFKAQFGKVNYFGGNGTTTFAVPDLRGEFLRGTGTAARSTGTGANVGKHQDATVHNYIGKEDGFYLDMFGVNPDFYDHGKDTMDTYITGSPRRWYLHQGGNDSEDGIHEFTSRPTNTAVMYCIKYEPTYVEERKFLVTRPDLWPVATEIDLGDGLYGFRKTGTITLPANTPYWHEPIREGHWNIVSYGGWYQVNSGTNATKVPVGQSTPQDTTLNLAACAYSSAVAAFKNLNGVECITLVSASHEPRTNAPYDVWVTYRKD